VWLAGAQDASGNSDQLVIAISGLLVAVITAAAGVIVALVNSKKTPTTPSPPPPEDHDDWIFARERIAVLDQRADDADGQREIQDRRLDQIERHLDLDRPNWKHDGGRRR
jgi:hypothetical protein